jgi:hypothetical protein
VGNSFACPVFTGSASLHLCLADLYFNPPTQHSDERAEEAADRDAAQDYDRAREQAPERSLRASGSAEGVA